ncbi:MAG: hypothetical protein IJ524_08990 [Bacteroidales bacterium]|nr:hypothetical protein [Bacteroidales bacterium]
MRKTVLILLTLLAMAGTASAQMVGATNRSRTQTHRETPTDKPVGWLLKAELGFPSSIVVGNQLNSNLMVGGGVGWNSAYYTIDLNKDDCRRWYMLPIFAEARFSIPKYPFGFFADLRVGIDLALLWDDFFYDDTFVKYPVGQVMAGISYRHISLGAGIQLSYNEEPIYDWYNGHTNWRGNTYPTIIFSVSYDLMLNR